MDEQGGNTTHVFSEAAGGNGVLERYRTLLNTIDDGIYQVDTDGRFVALNDVILETLGYSRAELLGEHVSTVLDEGDVQRIDREIEHHLETQAGELPTFEVPVETATGDEIACELRVNALVEDGTYEGSIGVARQISTQRITQRERELEQFQHIVETVNDGIYVVDEDGYFTMVNDAYANLLEYDREELVGEHVSRVVDESIRDQARALEAEMRAGEAVDPVVEADLETASGDTVIAQATFSLLDDVPGDQHRIGVVRDVTDRRERERELERALDLLGRTEEVADVGGWEIDTETMDVFWTDHIFDVLQVEADEEPPLDDALDMYHDEDQPLVEAAVETALETGDPFDIEARICTTSGAIRWLRLQGVSEVEDGEVVCLRGAAQNITEQKERERRLEQHRERLAALNQLNSVVQGVTETVIDRSTRSEIEQTACERIAAADSYSFAWIGAVDTATKNVVSRADAGVEGNLERQDISMDSASEDDPIERALRTGTVQIVRDTKSERGFDPIVVAADEHGFRSTAAIPIVHENTTYGVLNIYTERPNAFQAEEQNVVSHLGEIIGHAIAAAERKQALMSDAVVELEFHVDDVVDALGFEQGTDDPMRFHRSIPLPDGEFLVYGVTSPDVLATMEALTSESGFVGSVSVLGEEPDAVRFELRITDPPIMSEAAALGGSVERAVLDGRDLSLTIHLPPEVDVRQVIESLQDQYPHAEPVARRQVSGATDSTTRASEVWTEALTDRQRTVLETAYFAGFFEWPRTSSGEDIADTLDIAAPTFSEHLRAAERKVFGGLLDDTANGNFDAEADRLDRDQ